MRNLLRIAVICALCLVMIGCTNPASLDTTPTGAGDVSESALNFAGAASGTVATTSSTAGASAQEGRKLAPYALNSNSVLWLTDLDGNPLLDADGTEYGTFPINTNGTFALTGLPVGVEIVANVDLDGDGVADMFTIFNIPKDEGTDTGTLDSVVADPLSTMAYGKVQKLKADVGGAGGLEDLSINFTALVETIRIIFEGLLEEAGIELEIDMEDVIGKTVDALAAMFDTQMPDGAKRTMDMAESNAALAAAGDVESMAIAIAEALVQGGFMITQEPEFSELDLSSLTDLPNVLTMTMDEFTNEWEMDDHQSGQGAPSLWNPTVYFSTVTEPDRNFAQADGEATFMMRPMVNEHVLLEIAQAYLDGQTITLGNFHKLLTDAQQGLGLRLTYQIWSPPPAGEDLAAYRPATVFESADGAGVERDLEDLFDQLADADLFDASPADRDGFRARVRTVLINFLRGTVAPSLERLFGPILTERIPSADRVAHHLREARAHLPFSVSGPSRYYVVATADEWQSSNARPVTVNVQKDTDGAVQRVAYDSTGNGKFYVQFGPHEEDGGMQVGLILRQTGKSLFDKNGWQVWLDITDETIFAPVGSQSFYERFSETRTDWPTAPTLRIPNEWFDPALPPDPETNPPDWEVWTLMDGYEPDAMPVLVNYAEGVATAAEAGNYYVMPGAEWGDDGLFDLVSATGEILLADPTDPDSRVQVTPDQIQGYDVDQESFSWVYGIDLPNASYDPSGAPYYDDINGNGQWDAGEPTFDWREYLADLDDWRSCWVEMYYRTADGDFVNGHEVDWDAATPQLLDGTELVARDFRARLNAYRYGRPNIAINLLLGFSPPDFFNGTYAMNADTELNPLQAIALTTLVLDSIQNVQATVDWDGPDGPMEPHTEILDAWFFVPPINDPMELMVDAFEEFFE